MKTDIDELYLKINLLESENEYLKSLLDVAGISYITSDFSDVKEEENQGNRIIPKENISYNDIKKFYEYFFCRVDIFSKRTISKTTGKIGYYLQCNKIWKFDCPKISNKKFNCKECKNPDFTVLKIPQILSHLQGKDKDGECVIGIYPLLQDDTCKLLVFDFDNHGKSGQKNDFANDNNVWKDEVNALRRICEINDVDCLVERSRSGKGAHLWIFFEEKIDAKLARRFGYALLRKGKESVNLKTFSYYDRMFPVQDQIPKGGFGNLIALPLQGLSLYKGNSAFVDRNWNAYPNQWDVLFYKKKLSKSQVEDKIKLWLSNEEKSELSLFDAEQDNTFEPWDKRNNFHKIDVNGEFQIVLADGIYIKKDNLKPRIMNQVCELASFYNPIFFSNIRNIKYNYNQSLFIYLGKDINNYIKIPRGLLEKLQTKLDEAEIGYYIKDKRQIGKSISVGFNGELKDFQISAVNKMLQYDNGILQAATAFGKTVVSCNIIARRKVNTLILVHTKALLEQWEKSLKEFLIIDEEFPTYKTKTGIIKTRKSCIGKIESDGDKSTGIIDIAMIGSLRKGDELNSRLKEYGMIILDECHHAATKTATDVLQFANAKYVLGVTATPNRGDKLNKTNLMLLGPIRYKYTAKQRAQEQGIDHLVYPRFTRTVAPRFNREKMEVNDAYELLRNNDERDNLIISDIKDCINQGRTPIVLSRYVDHSRKLYDKLQGCADHIFILYGKNTKKENRSIIRQMNNVKADESMILIATGSLVGEGFDYPRLDTLFMTTPVSGSNVVEQYTGRLNRDYEGKRNVIVYDYVDGHIPIFENMYNKRLKAYKKIGYDICTFNETKEYVSVVNSIYDFESYKEVYDNDLENACKEIIISSPVISSYKIESLIQQLSKQQQNGVRVIIITWKPDSYGFGDSTCWIRLHERMRLSGFEVNVVEDYCEHYCIIDRKIVWYGSMNFLGKEDIDDNLMRIIDEKIALELLRLTFTNDKYLGELL